MPININKKKLLCEFVNYNCEECKKKFKLNELEIHRINKGMGYKDHRNLKVVCKKCHDYYSAAKRIANGIQGR